MRGYSLTHVRDDVLLRDLNALIAQERGTMAVVLAHLAEVDARKLFVPLGYSSMFAYCVEELRLSEDAAYKRIQAARVARQFPILFEELAEGRLHLTAVCLLAPHLTEKNVTELVRAAAHRRKSEIEDLLALCLPSSMSAGPGAQTLLAPEQVRRDEPDENGLTFGQLAPEQVQGDGPDPGGLTSGQLAPEQVGGSIPSQVPQLVPLMVLPEIRDRVRYMQALLSHALPTGDVSKVLARALDLLTDEVEKRRFGAGSGVRRRRTGARTRYIPADVRHAVWNRDGGRCTFVGTNGHRCNSDEARQALEEQKARTAADRRAREAANAEVREQLEDVLSALRGLGIKGDQARRAAARAELLPGASLEERIRAALEFHGECVMRNPRAARLLAASG